MQDTNKFLNPNQFSQLVPPINLSDTVFWTFMLWKRGKALFSQPARLHGPMRRTNVGIRERELIRNEVKCTNKMLMASWDSNLARSAWHGSGSDALTDWATKFLLVEYKLTSTERFRHYRHCRNTYKTVIKDTGWIKLKCPRKTKKAQHIKSHNSRITSKRSYQ